MITFGVSVANGVFTGQAVNKTWDIAEQTEGGSNASLTFQWAATDELTAFNRNSVYVSHYTNNAWDSVALSSASGTDPYTATRAGIITFSPFAIVSSASLLPVTFTRIQASLSGKNIVVSWQASDDAGTRDYNIQRSTDGRIFTNIGQQQRLTGNGLHSYIYTDVNAAALSAATVYYRLQPVTANGSGDVSQTVSVKLSSPSSSFHIWPSPASDVLHIKLTNATAQGKVGIYDAAGKMMMYSSIQNDSQTDIKISQLPGGEYLIKVYTNSGTMNGKFIKK